ncbi:Hypoxanthine-guanine phosphoribosyltransferase [Clostridiales bacterium CHKCI006]|nr:Hypoxanthine-guanine phosphoribosyltransferase [Clostridiales bacterium CHKCI006]
MHQDVQEILFSLEEIQHRTRKLGEQISRDYAGKTLILVGLLKGSVPFMAELMRYLTVDVRIDFMNVSSYTGAQSGQVVIKKDMEQDIAGKDVLIVEDIIDTGNTLYNIKKMLEERKCASCKIVTLLDKVESRTIDIQADYVGFDIPNAFVVGFGLDFDEKYRQLPYIGILKKECYE